MGNPWFRLHTDFLTNDRIQLLSFDDRAHYVAILCLKCRGSLDKFKDDPELRLMSISKAIGLDPLTADEVRFRLMKVGLLDENWEPAGWGKRQYQSDKSTDRVRKHRAKKQQCNAVKRQCNKFSVSPVKKAAKKTTKNQLVKDTKRQCNVSETAPDTETDTETDTDTEKTPPRGCGPSRRVPKTWQLSEGGREFAAKKGLSPSQIETELELFRNYEWSKPKTDFDACWRTRCINWRRFGGVTETVSRDKPL